MDKQCKHCQHSEFDPRPTILVTNLTLAEIQETLGERVFDRFREVATVVTFDWPSFRGKRAA